MVRCFPDGTKNPGKLAFALCVTVNGVPGLPGTAVTVPPTFWVVGRLPMFTLPETFCVAGRFLTVTVPPTLSAPVDETLASYACIGSVTRTFSMLDDRLPVEAATTATGARTIAMQIADTMAVTWRP